MSYHYTGLGFPHQRPRSIHHVDIGSCMRYDFYIFRNFYVLIEENKLDANYQKDCDKIHIRLTIDELVT